MFTNWKCKEFKIVKYNTTEDYESQKPSQIDRFEGNCVTINGLKTLWHLINGTKPIGASDSYTVYPFNEDNLYIGVGTGNSPVATPQDVMLTAQQATGAGQTAYAKIVLEDGATSKFSYNSDDNSCSMTISAMFESNAAKFTWCEWGIFNGNPADPGSRKIPASNSADLKDYDIVMLNHKTEAMGTKEQGSIWIVQVTITLQNGSTI